MLPAAPSLVSSRQISRAPTMRISPAQAKTPVFESTTGGQSTGVMNSEPKSAGYLNEKFASAKVSQSAGIDSQAYWQLES